jgi:hypothetical protein
LNLVPGLHWPSRPTPGAMGGGQPGPPPPLDRRNSELVQQRLQRCATFIFSQAGVALVTNSDDGGMNDVRVRHQTTTVMRRPA